MVDYLGWRIALPLADVAIGLRHRLVAVSQALGPPAPPRGRLAAGEDGRHWLLRSWRARAECARPRHRYLFPTASSSYTLPGSTGGPMGPVRRSKGDAGMRRDNRHALATRTMHGGSKPDPTTGVVTRPIYATSTYAQESPGSTKATHSPGPAIPRERPWSVVSPISTNGTAGFAFAPDRRRSPPCSSASTKALM